MNVSVIIPVRGTVQFLAQAITSAAEAGASEIVVVPHGSDERVDELVDGCVDIRGVRLVRCPFTMPGPAEPKNAGLRAARCEFVTFLDADDVLVPGAIECRASALRLYPDAAASFGRIVGLIDEYGHPIADANVTAWLQSSYEWLGRHRSLGPTDIVEKRLPGYATIMYRRSVLETVLFDTLLPCAEDFDFAYRVASTRGGIVFVDAEVLKYRVHSNNTSIERGPDGVVARKINRSAHQAALAKHGLLP